MIGAYYVTTHWLHSDLAAFVVFGVLTNLIINVLLPVWWIAYHRKQPLSELGITTRRWLPSLLIGIGLAAFSSLGLRHKAAGMDWLPHVLFNAVILWEPFFVFSWLQLRFDRAFGIVPGVLLAGLSFAAYHIGTYPPAGLVTLLIWGLIFAAIFRLRVATGLEHRLVNRHRDGRDAVHLEPSRDLVGRLADPVGFHRLHVVEAEQGG
jgi:hypothetical protein